MKYKDKNTLLLQSKNQKETNQYGFPFESDRKFRRRRKKQLLEFWAKNLKGFIPQDFWNALELNEQSSVSFEFRNFEGDKIEDFITKIRERYKDKLQISRELTFKRLGI